MRTAIFLLGLLLSTSGLNAQEFSFGTDLADGRPTGSARGGLATGYMQFAVDANQLTAVLRNTSPVEQNPNSAPYIRRFDFQVSSLAGGSPELASWELSAADATGAAVVLGNSLGQGLDMWRLSDLGNGVYRFRSRGGRDPKAPLYNSNASNGFRSPQQYFTQAVLVASFNAAIGARDLNPEIRYGNIGRSGAGRSLSGVSIRSSANPEPASLLAWSGLLACIAYRWRKSRKRPAAA